MTADQLAAALLAERYATPVAEHRHNEGPTLWWQQHEAVREAWSTGRDGRPQAIHRLVHNGADRGSDVRR